MDELRVSESVTVSTSDERRATSDERRAMTSSMNDEGIEYLESVTARGSHELELQGHEHVYRLRIEGQSVIVTGAAAGIGRATAVRFAEEGARSRRGTSTRRPRPLVEGDRVGGRPGRVREGERRESHRGRGRGGRDRPVGPRGRAREQRRDRPRRADGQVEGRRGGVDHDRRDLRCSSST